MQRFSAAQTLPADLETTFKLITTEDYFIEKYKAMQAVNVAIDVLEDTDTVFRVAVERDISLGDSVPGFARKMVGESMRIQQQVAWHKNGEVPRKGDFTGKLLGKDGGVSAELFLEPDGDQCVMRIEGKINVNVPLVGGKIEKLMVERSADAFSYDLQASADYIAQKTH